MLRVVLGAPPKCVVARLAVLDNYSLVDLSSLDLSLFPPLVVWDGCGVPFVGVARVVVVVAHHVVVALARHVVVVAPHVVVESGIQHDLCEVHDLGEVRLYGVVHDLVRNGVLPPHERQGVVVTGTDDVPEDVVALSERGDVVEMEHHDEAHDEEVEHDEDHQGNVVQQHVPRPHRGQVHDVDHQEVVLRAVLREVAPRADDDDDDDEDEGGKAEKLVIQKNLVELQDHLQDDHHQEGRPDDEDDVDGVHVLTDEFDDD